MQIDIEAEEQRMADDAATRLVRFLESIATLYPEYRNEQAEQIFQNSQVSGYQINKVARPSSITLSSLQYKEASA